MPDGTFHSSSAVPHEMDQLDFRVEISVIQQLCEVREDNFKVIYIAAHFDYEVINLDPVSLVLFL